MEKVEFPLGGAIDEEPTPFPKVADIPPDGPVSNESGPAEAKRRVAFIEDVLKGIKPDHAARARGFDDKWRDDESLAYLIDIAEAQCIAGVERAIYGRVLACLPIPAPAWYWMEARAGYDRKTKEDGLPQNVVVEERIVE